MKSRKSFLLRINPDLYEALEAWAQQDLRSINGQIEYLLKEAVRKHGREVEGGGGQGTAESKKGIAGRK